MESYRKDAEQRGAVLALNCEVVGGNVSSMSSQLGIKIAPLSIIAVNLESVYSDALLRCSCYAVQHWPKCRIWHLTIAYRFRVHASVRVFSSYVSSTLSCC